MTYVKGRADWISYGQPGATIIRESDLDNFESGIYNAHYNAVVSSDSTSNVPLTVRPFSSSQSGDLTQWNDSGGTARMSVGATALTFSLDDGASKPDVLVWNASSLRAVRSLTLAGSGTVGSANQWTSSFHADIPAATSSPAHYEKAALTAFIRTKDPSNTVTPINRDAVGADIRGWIDGSVTTGRVWGLYVEGQAAAGSDGLVQGIEVAVRNNGTTGTIDTTDSKVGLSVNSYGPNNSTAAIYLGSGGALWKKGLFSRPSMFSAGATFLELQSGTNNRWNIGSDAGLMQMQKAATTDYVAVSQVDADSQSRFALRADGVHEWGPGNASRDVSLYRQTWGLEATKALNVVLPSLPGPVFASYLTGDANNRISLSMQSTGSTLAFGDGTATPVQVLTSRRTGWTAATNTKTRTTFDTTTVTLPVLAAHVGALIDDLITHGLIGA